MVFAESKFPHEGVSRLRRSRHISMPTQHFRAGLSYLAPTALPPSCPQRFTSGRGHCMEQGLAPDAGAKGLPGTAVLG
jgi:hypothetical protein